MEQIGNIIVEGIDRLGKSTFIKNVLNENNSRFAFHSSKPYSDHPILENRNYYNWIFKNMFEPLNDGHVFDRLHLGEYVYGNLYRNLDLNAKQFIKKYELLEDHTYDYVFERSALVLLVTSDFNILKDDGLSIDFKNKKKEQDMFIEVFQCSSFKNKLIIDVSGDGTYRNEKDIFNDFKVFLKESNYTI